MKVEIMAVYVCGPRNRNVKNYVSTVSRAAGWSRGLSPFYLGPCPLYGIYVSFNMENAWQYSKVYPKYADANGEPLEEYFTWAQYGWNKKRADRYPMGRGAKPLYSYWDGKKFGYVEARKKIYAPLYANAVEKTEAYRKLKELYDAGDLWLWDFDGYNHHDLGMSYEDVINCEDRKMGHALVLAMMLDNQRVWEK